MPFLGAAFPALAPGSNPATELPALVPFLQQGQPFALWGNASWSGSGSYGVLLAGCIFNTAELASTLGAEAQQSPSVLLSRAYRAWGLDFPKHIEGEYAFVLWDGEAQRLILGRDSTGSRPLFYMRHGRGLLFFSELRRAAQWPEVVLRPNQRRIAQWLAISTEPTNRTFFENVFSVTPGAILVFKDGRIAEHSFWRPEQTPLLRLRDSREYADGLVHVLEKAVQDRLPATGAGASQLSGGLDSSTVTATAARLLAQDGRRLFAFTAVPAHAVDIPDRFTDEGPHAAAVARMYPNIEHVQVRHGAHRVFALIDLFNAASGEPAFNPSNYDWIYEICRQAAARGVDTLLTGAAGNFTISYAGQRALRDLLGQGRLLAAARQIGTMRRHGTRSWLGIANELLRPWLPAGARLAIDRVFGRESGTQQFCMIRQEFARANGIRPLELEDGHLRLDSRSMRLAILRRADAGPLIEPFRQMTGVSMSDPSKDRRVIEYCLSVPVEYYCENGVPRSLIRNAMAGRLPDEVRLERRKGLQAADFEFFFEKDRPEALAEVALLKNFDLPSRALDLEAMEQMLRSTPDSAAGQSAPPWHLSKLMRALSLGRFLRRFEEGTLFSASETPVEVLRS